MNSTPPNLRKERIEELMKIARESQRYGDLACQILKNVEVPERNGPIKMRSTYKTIRTPNGTFVTSARTLGEMDDFTQKLNTPYGLL